MSGEDLERRAAQRGTSGGASATEGTARDEHVAGGDHQSSDERDQTVQSMTLTVVGCAGSFPSPESPASCYLLQAPYEGRTYSLLMDLGNGALGPLQRYVDPLAVDAVALSHLHADHCLDMCGYYVMRKYHPDGELPRIPVFGPSTASEHLARAYDLPMPVGMTEQFGFSAWESGETIELGPFRITPSRMVHPVEAYALRVEHDGHSLVYSGDTGATDALVELARGADALLCEASFVESRDNPAGIHLTGKEAGEHAASAEVGRLLVTHIPAWTDRETVAAEAKGAYAGPIDLVGAGDRYTF